MVIQGWERASGEELCIINVYAPCEMEEKLKLWDRLSVVVEQREGLNLCIIGDFNSILGEAERAGSGGVFRKR